MKRTISKIGIIVCAVVLFTLLTVVAVMGVDNYTLIETPQDFLAIEDNLDGKYKLSNDIDFEGVEYTVIGTEETPFTGVLDGAGFTVKNVIVEANTADDAYVALFSSNEGEITNIKFDNVSVIAKSSASVYAAVVAGINSGDISSVTVTDSSVTAQADYGISRAAGICAYNSGVGTVSTCSVAATVKATSNHLYADKDAIVAVNLGEVTDCIDNSTPDVTYGDTTGDGDINLFDLIRMAKYITDSSTELDIAAADVTGDGTVNLFDLIRLAKHITDDSVVLGPAQ